MTVWGDPSRLRQLVTNLLDNAVRFTDPGGSVTLRVDRNADRAMLRVKDTGIGIPAAHLPHIFERFYQADAARSSGACGLGLSICRWIVKAHRGTIEADSAERKGTEFTVVLPLGCNGRPAAAGGDQDARQVRHPDRDARVECPRGERAGGLEEAR